MTRASPAAASKPPTSNQDQETSSPTSTEVTEANEGTDKSGSSRSKNIGGGTGNKRKRIIIVCLLILAFSSFWKLQIIVSSITTDGYSINQLLFSSQEKSTSSPTNTPTANLTFSLTNTPTNATWCANECLWKAGINGHWEQDWNYSQRYGQYADKPLAVPLGPFQRKVNRAFRPSSDAPFPWTTSWKWIEHDNCPVDVMTHEKLCRVLGVLKIHRIYFRGDSLSRQMHASLANMIGRSNFINLPTNTQNTWSSTFLCPTADAITNTSWEVKMMLGNAIGGNAFPNSPILPFSIGEEDLKFLNSYNNSDDNDRVLAIYNHGAHYHNTTIYQEDTSKLIEFIQKLNRSQDINIFRATSPGHHGCQKFDRTKGTRIKPFKTYDQYSIPRNHRYDWDKFEMYNTYTKNYVRSRASSNSKDQEDNYFPLIHFLDIWNMTAMRRDGHYGGRDCLHFVVPGPVEWWNHLLYTFLQNLSIETDQSCIPAQFHPPPPVSL